MKITLDGYGKCNKMDEIRNAINEIKINYPKRSTRINLVFNEELERNTFENNFPKYVKLTRSHYEGVNQTFFYLVLCIDGLTKQSGEINEAGEKRLNKFLDVLKKLDYLN